MSGKLHIIQANMRKSCESTRSFFHDPDFENVSLLLLTELYATFNLAKLPESVPLYHTKWQPIFLASVLTSQPTEAIALSFAR